MASSGWLEQKGGGLCVGSGVSELGLKESMEKDKVLVACEWPSLWGAEEVNASPPTLAESPVASAECEEGEECEDYVCDLAEQIAQSMLEEDEEISVNNVPWVIEGPKPACSAQKASLPSSPQSTLAGIGCCTWDLSRTASSGGLSSGVSSPPTPVAATEVGEDDALDLLYAELLRLNLEDEIKASKQQQFQLQQQQQQYQQLLLKMKQSPNLVSSDGYVKGKGGSLYSTCSPTHSKGTGATGSSVRSRSRNEEQNQQFCARKQVSACWGGPPPQQHHQSSSGSGHGSKRSLDITQSHHHHFPFNSSHQQAMNGSGMRAVFLGTPGSREVGGTGVFLPRRIGSGPDTKRKPACSTVLLPSRIVQALNLNVEDTLACPIGLPTTTARRDYSSAAPTWRQNSPVPTKRSDPTDEWSPSLHHPSYSPLQEVAPDISLPTEWTY